MSAAEGFERMDVSTAIDDDPKFRALARRHPEAFAVAFTAYVGMMARSWRQGERLTAEEAWPPLLPYDPAAVTAMRDVLLLDDDARIPAGAWERHFGEAFERRRAGRERWSRYNEHRPSKSPPAPPSDSQSDSQSVITRYPRGTHAVPTGRTVDKGRDHGPTLEEARTAFEKPNGSDGVLPAPPRLPSPEEAARLMAEIRANVPALTP